MVVVISGVGVSTVASLEVNSAIVVVSSLTVVVSAAVAVAITAPKRLFLW